MLQSSVRWFVIVALLSCIGQSGLAQLETPQPSPKGKVEQKWES